MGRAEEGDEGPRVRRDEKDLGGFARGYVEEDVDWQIEIGRSGGWEQDVTS